MIRESFITLQMDCRHGREEGTCPRRALTPNHSREFYSQVSRFESKAFTNYSPEFHSHPNMKIQNFNSHSPEFHSQKQVSSPRKLFNFTFHQFFFLRSSRALSYLILIRVRLSCETNVTFWAHARVHFSPKFFPSLTERRGSCLKLNSGIVLVKYLALTQLGTKLQFPLVSSPWKLLRGIVSLKLKKPKQPRSPPFSFSSSFFVLFFSLEIAFRFGFYRIFNERTGNRGEFRHV